MKGSEYPEGLDQWIVDYLKGEIGEEEWQRLNRWRQASERHEQLFEQYCDRENWQNQIIRMEFFDTEEGWKQVLERTVKGRSFRWRRFAGIVAAVAVVGGIALSLFFPLKEQGTRGNMPGYLPENTGICMSRSTGEVYRLDTVQKIETGSALFKTDSGKMVVVSQNPISQPPVYNTVDVPVGGEYVLILADGSEVFLNSETSFRFPENFDRDSVREVFLAGEAYFNVVSDSAKPFIVHTEQTFVKVLGTSFNIMAYENMPEQQTTLVRGHVSVGDRFSRRVIDLRPGRQAVYHKETGKMENREVDVAYYTAWKEGWFAFRERRLEEVMEILARWYGFDFFFQNSEAREYVYTGKIERHRDLNAVLENFRLTEELDFSVNEKTVIIKTKN